jgi:hypothetical protein
MSPAAWSHRTVRDTSPAANTIRTTPVTVKNWRMGMRRPPSMTRKPSTDARARPIIPPTRTAQPSSVVAAAIRNRAASRPSRATARKATPMTARRTSPPSAMAWSTLSWSSPLILWAWRRIQKIIQVSTTTASSDTAAKASSRGRPVRFSTVRWMTTPTATDSAAAAAMPCHIGTTRSRRPIRWM